MSKERSRLLSDRPSYPQRTHSRLQIFTAAAGLIALIPILLHAYAGSFARMIADDFCSSAIARTLGPLKLVETWYLTWTGTYANALIKGAIGSFDPSILVLLTPLLLGLWFAGLFALFRMVFRWRGLRYPALLALLTAAALINATTAGSPAFPQSLYWMAASIPYTLPLILFTFYLLLVMRTGITVSHHRRLIALIGGLLCLFSGGLAETWSAIQLTAAVVVLAGVEFFASQTFRQRTRLLLITGVIGAGIALVILVTAPGSQGRAELFGGGGNLLKLIADAGIHAAAFAVSAIGMFAPVGALSVVLLGGQAALYEGASGADPERRWVFFRLAAILIGTGAILTGFTAVGFYGTGQVPPARTYIIPQYALVAGLFLLGHLLGTRLRQARSLPASRLRGLTALTLAVVMIAAAGEALRVRDHLPLIQQFATNWDARHAQIRAAIASGTHDLILEHDGTPYEILIGLDPIGADPNHWANGCAAEYYGLDSLRINHADGT